ncbi:MAG: lipid-A-disaccharide synthase, partial [Cyclobacteriaceae bacterium]|nr:lipid-A-disaccharide synthase [Cyclobacteriaceae bacterium]
MKYFLIAGERSGDLHGSWLVKALLHQDPDARIYAFGGDYMKKEGAHVLSHYKEASFMGFWEVVKNAGVIRRRFKTCRQAIEDIRPDILILIDYPGFNLRMARYARQQGIKTLYYISPKIWAWKKGRIRQIRAFVDRMCVIFPFEVGFYRSLDYPVTYVGNPLVEQVDGFRFSDLNELPDYDTTIAFLPGSRQQEVATSVQMILALAERMQHSLLLVAGVDNLDPAVYVPLSGKENIRVVVGKTYEVLKRSQAAV